MPALAMTVSILVMPCWVFRTSMAFCAEESSVLLMMTGMTLLPAPVGSASNDLTVGCDKFLTPAMIVVFGLCISASSNPLPSPECMN